MYIYLEIKVHRESPEAQYLYFHIIYIEYFFRYGMALLVLLKQPLPRVPMFHNSVPLLYAVLESQEENYKTSVQMCDNQDFTGRNRNRTNLRYGQADHEKKYLVF